MSDSRLNLVAAMVCFSLVKVAFGAEPRPVTLATLEGTNGSGAKDLEGLITYVASSSNMRLVVKTFPDYDAAYAAFKDRKVDLTLIGPVKYVEAHHASGAIPVVAEEPRAQQSMVVVRRGSPIKSVAELKGKKFAFGYEDATSTHLMPLLLLSKYHLTEKDLVKVAFLGSEQEKIVDAVVATVVYQHNKGRVQLLEASEPFPGAVIVAHKDADVRWLHELRDLLLGYKPPVALTKLRFGHGVAPIEDADFNKIRFLTKVLFNRTYH